MNDERGYPAFGPQRQASEQEAHGKGAEAFEGVLVEVSENVKRNVDGQACVTPEGRDTGREAGSAKQHLVAHEVAHPGEGVGSPARCRPALGRRFGISSLEGRPARSDPRGDEYEADEAHSRKACTQGQARLQLSFAAQDENEECGRHQDEARESLRPRMVSQRVDASTDGPAPQRDLQDHGQCGEEHGGGGTHLHAATIPKRAE